MKQHLGIALSALLALGATSAQAADFANLQGRGSMGASAGVMSFLSGEQFGNNPSPRFIFQASFKYNITDAWTLVAESGWGWNAYASNEEGVNDTLATVIPTTFGAQYRTRYKETIIYPNLGAGVGLYSMGVKDEYNSWAYANQGTEKLTWTKPGFYLKGGLEWIFSDFAAINIDVAWHMIMASDDRFDRWGNQNTSFAQLRVGGSYYFSLGGGEDDSPDEDED